MMDQAFGRALALDGHHQGRACQLGAHVVAHRPADNFAGTEIQHCGEVKPALAGGDIGDVRKPLFIGPEGPEVPVEQVVSNREVMQAVRRGDAEFSSGDGEYVIVPHAFFDRSAAGLMALDQKLGMDARAAIGGVFRMDGLDRRQHCFCCKLARTRLARGPRIVTAG